MCSAKAEIAPAELRRVIPIEVAIVGAGAAGLYSAMRILDSRDAEGEPASPDLLRVFDATDHLGGRISTLGMKKFPFTADIGAMRFIYGRQLLVSSLADHPDFDSEIVTHSVPTSRTYLRGKNLLPDMKPGQPILEVRDNQTRGVPQRCFSLRPHENYVAPDDMIAYGLAQALARLDFEKRGKVATNPLKRQKRGTVERISRIKSVLTQYQAAVDEYEGSRRSRRRARSVASAGALFESQAREGEAATIEAAARSKLSEAVIELRTLLREDLKFDFFTIEQWKFIREAGKIDDELLFESCLFSIVENELSSEALALAQDAFGYRTIFGAANAAEHLPWFLNEFGQVDYKCLKGGMSKLVHWMESRISAHYSSDDARHSWFQPGSKLISVSQVEGAEREYLLKLRVGENSVRWYRAKKVILATSKGALERIEFGTEFMMTDALKKATGAGVFGDAVRCVAGNPLMKAFLFYERPWFWDDLHETQRAAIAQLAGAEDAEESARAADAGGSDAKPVAPTPRVLLSPNGQFVCTRILTDLPMSQVFFHGPGGTWWQGREDELVKGMVMAYGDSRQAEIWSSLARRGDSGRRKQEYEGDAAFAAAYSDGYDEVWQRFACSTPLYRLMQKNISAILRGRLDSKTREQNIDALELFLCDWSAPPYYGGWHAWHANYRPWKVRQKIMQPFHNEDIYVCGEAFSADQGWIEGALRTAERMLQEHLGLDIPDWVNTDLLRGTSWEDCGGKDEILKEYLDW